MDKEVMIVLERLSKELNDLGEALVLVTKRVVRQHEDLKETANLLEAASELIVNQKDRLNEQAKTLQGLEFRVRELEGRPA
jgi:chaperonin cofactor prefoldin